MHAVGLEREVSGMKIRITWPVDKDGIKDGITIDAGAADVVCSLAFCGVGIDTDIGRFGIAQRDGVIEVMFEGRLLFSSDQMKMAIEDTETEDK